MRLTVSLLALLVLVVPGRASSVGVEIRPPGAEDPSWLDDRTLVYSDTVTQDVFVRTLGGAPVKLTDEGRIYTWERIRRWTVASSDGTKIAYLGDAGVTVMSADGRNRTVVDKHYELGPMSFSPDGSRIAYDASKGIRVAQLAGGSPMKLTAEGGDPDWSPNGALIAYDTGLASSTILVVAPDGSGRRALVPGARPHWSPDGSQIVYEHDEGIWLVDPMGSAPRRLATGAEPRWLPGGRTILYTGKAHDLRTIDVAGGAPRLILETSQYQRTAVPSPDGRHIAYVVDNEEPQSQGSASGNVSDLYVANVDGGARTELTGTCGVTATADPRVTCLIDGRQSIPLGIASDVRIRVLRVLPASGRYPARVRGYLVDGAGRHVRDAVVDTNGKSVWFYPFGVWNDGFFSIPLSRHLPPRPGERIRVTLVAYIDEAHPAATTTVAFPARYLVDRHARKR